MFIINLNKKNYVVLFFIKMTREKKWIELLSFMFGDSLRLVFFVLL